MLGAAKPVQPYTGLSGDANRHANSDPEAASSEALDSNPPLARDIRQQLRQRVSIHNMISEMS
jgi:hypothetical protein